MLEVKKSYMRNAHLHIPNKQVRLRTDFEVPGEVTVNSNSQMLDLSSIMNDREDLQPLHI